MSMAIAPTIEEIRAAHANLGHTIRRTPVIEMPVRECDANWTSSSQALLKLELMQLTGTFKARAALNGIMGLTADQRAKGVTAVSAGNHAVAVAFAAMSLGVSAKLVMLKTANPLRVELTRGFGAEIEFAEDGKSAFARVQQIEAEEGRYFVHPFEGRGPVTGTATLGWEWFEQCGAMDAVVIACGGGGLLAGVACAMKQLAPSTRVFGVEPTGANGMFRSFQEDRPVTLQSVSTIADSLAPPMTTPYTFSVCKRYVERIILVDDEAIRDAMKILLYRAKLAVEPAGAVALAGVLTGLREPLQALRRIGILVCGSNIDARTYCSHINR